MSSAAMRTSAAGKSSSTELLASSSTQPAGRSLISPRERTENTRFE